MSNQQKNSPASEGALDRTFRNKSLRIGCLILIARPVFYSNAEVTYFCGDVLASLTPEAIQQTMEKALKPETHIGRTNAVQHLTALISNGVLTKDDAHWLRYVAKLVEAEGDINIDPLLEVCRRILARHLAAGGRHG